MYKQHGVHGGMTFDFLDKFSDSKLFVRHHGTGNPTFVALTSMPALLRCVNDMKNSKEKRTTLTQICSILEKQHETLPILDDIISSGLLLEIVQVLEGSSSYETKYLALRILLVCTIQPIPERSLLVDEKCLHILFKLLTCDCDMMFTIAPDPMKTTCATWSCVCLFNILRDPRVGNHVCGVLLEHDFAQVLTSRMTNMRSFECFKCLFHLIGQFCTVVKRAFPDKIELFMDISRQFPSIIARQHLSDGTIAMSAFECLYTIISADERLFVAACECNLFLTLLDSLNKKCFAPCFRCLNLFCHDEIPQEMCSDKFGDIVMSMFPSLDAPDLKELFIFMKKMILGRVRDVDIPKFTMQVLEIRENASFAVTLECSEFLVAIFNCITNHVPPCDPVIIDRVIELIAETLEQKSDSSLSETLTVLIEFTKNSTAISSLTSLWTLKEALMELSNDHFKDQIELILTQLNAVL